MRNAYYQLDKSLKAQGFLNGGLWTITVVLGKETATVTERGKQLAACTRVDFTPGHFSAKTQEFFPRAVRKAGSQPLSLQHIGISRFKAMRLGFFG